MCCNGDERAPADIVLTSTGPGPCSVGFRCGNTVPFLTPRAVDWVIPADGGDSFCECAAVQDPLDCIASSRIPGLPGEVLPQAYCDLAIEDDGSLCPDQLSTIRDRLRDFLPPTPLRCPVSVWWQTGPVAIAFRSQGSVAETTTTDDCDADIVFEHVGPPTGPIPATTPATAIGWYIIEVSEDGNPANTKLVPMHAHRNPVSGCEHPLFCGFE
jgi:hypothetical protein